MKRRLIYIAGPYTADTKEEVKKNIQEAEEVARKILLAGHIPVIPHKITSFFDVHEDLRHWTKDDWINNFCLPLLDRCDALCVLPRWRDSEGSVYEHAHAEANGMTIISSYIYCPT